MELEEDKIKSTWTLRKGVLRMTTWEDRTRSASSKVTGSAVSGAGPSGSATRQALILSWLLLTYPDMCNAVKSGYLSLIGASIIS